jgi:hypothetical protein
MNKELEIKSNALRPWSKSDWQRSVGGDPRRKNPAKRKFMQVGLIHILMGIIGSPLKIMKTLRKRKQ